MTSSPQGRVIIAEADVSTAEQAAQCKIGEVRVPSVLHAGPDRRSDDCCECADQKVEKSIPARHPPAERPALRRANSYC